MRKRKNVIIVSSIVSLLLLAIIADICVAFYPVITFRSLISGHDNWIKAANTKVQRIDPEPINPKNGFTIKKFGLTMVLPGYNDAELAVDGKSSALYKLPDGKSIMLMNSMKNYSQIDESFDSYHFSPIEKKQIETAMGRRVHSRFDFELASYKATQSDFSLYNSEKNFGVKKLLEFKTSGKMRFSSLYSIEKEHIVSLIFNDSSIYADFANPQDTEYAYGIMFIDGFTLDQVASIINSTVFD